MAISPGVVICWRAPRFWLQKFSARSGSPDRREKLPATGSAAAGPVCRPARLDDRSFSAPAALLPSPTMKTSCNLRPSCSSSEFSSSSRLRGLRRKWIFFRAPSGASPRSVGFAGMELTRAEGVGLHRAFLGEFLHGDGPGGFAAAVVAGSVRRRGNGWSGNRRAGQLGFDRSAAAGFGVEALRDLAQARTSGAPPRRFQNAFERNFFLELAHLDQRDLEDDVLGQRIAQAAFEMAQFFQNAERGAARNLARDTSARTSFSGVEISPSNAVGETW
jgi:hypothetical protein